MEKILSTDNATQAIEKINANFDLASTTGAKVIEDSFTGSGSDIVYYYFDAKPGDYIHVKFPGGTWSVSTGGTYRFWFGYVDKENTICWLTNICQLSWPVQEYGYDLYFPDDITNMKQGYLAFRATRGLNVPFTIEWLDKTNMKPYFSDEMVDTVTKVRARQGSSTVTLAICTDLHYRCVTEAYRPFAPYNAIAMGLTMKELGKRVRLDNIICMGDIIQGEQTAAIAKRDADDMQRSFARAEVPLLTTIGNHDDNRYYSREDGDRRLTKAEMHAYFAEYLDERVSIGGAEQECNCYRDIDRNKIRLISLLSTDLAGSYSFTSATRTWLSATFDSMPEGYKAIIFSHTPLRSERAWGEGFSNGAATETIIKNNSNKLIAFFDGHTHVDNLWMSPFPEVNIGCVKCYNPEGGELPASAPADASFAERASGDARELLYDVAVINQEEELLSCIRFGAGVDRYVHYIPVDVEAGGTTTLTPSVLTATSWTTRESESELISVEDGVVSIDGQAEEGSRLTVRAVDADGNFEIWAINVTSEEVV